MSVAISGDFGIVGAYFKDPNDASTSDDSAYVYRLSTLGLAGRLTPQGAERHRGPWRVAASGRRAAMATYSINPAAMAYAFDLAECAQTAGLSVEGVDQRAVFGHSIDLQGQRLIVGAPGGRTSGGRTGVAFLLDIQSGKTLRKFVATDAQPVTSFGTAVALSRTRAIIGAPGITVAGKEEAGAVYVFDIETGEQIARLTEAEPREGAVFGDSVAIDEGRCVIGAPGQGDLKGRAYCYELRDDMTATELVPSESEGGDWFGVAVEITDGLAVVGASGGRQGKGAAFAFNTATGREVYRFSPPDLDEAAYFGQSVAISDEWIIIGAPLRDSDKQEGVGAVYVFRNPQGPK